MVDSPTTVSLPVESGIIKVGQSSRLQESAFSRQQTVVKLKADGYFKFLSLPAQIVGK